MKPVSHNNMSQFVHNQVSNLNVET